jgi:RNA polymerase sigma-70 factor (ECF subfamily)
VAKRTNEEWLSDLRGEGQDEALSDLRALLKRGLTYALSGRPNVDEGAIEDFCQDALLKILEKLDTFRGESQFTTWAQKIAVYTAFTELRRRRWRDVSLNGIVEAREGDDSLAILTDSTAGPEQETAQGMLINMLQRLIKEELTDKQRQAMTAAVFKGMPLDEVARRMGSNRNALYKLLHDARKRLKKRMLAEGLSAQDVLAAFDKG